MLSENTREGGVAELKSRPSSCGLHPNFFLFPQFSALIFCFVFFVSHLKSAFHSSLWYKYSESMVIIPTVGRLLFTPLC